ncbi:hypothetical protein M426DRAFT_319589 [Hypoxylon sp. CI-4A]|nr:hypothetical protein M426DRAFT_319589 [Hypoxylon sp. CI-4A]
MSSITTTIPTSPIERWCFGPLEEMDGTRMQCANATDGTRESDFQTFCCDGGLANTAHDLFGADFYQGANRSLNLSEMLCCGLKGGAQPGGLHPLPADNTHCAQGGAPTPLASLAATNTDNAVDYVVTYTSASFGADGAVGDFVPTTTPYCFFAYTPGVGVETVTLPSPTDLTPLTPPTTDVFGLPIVSSTTTTRPKATATATESGGSVTATSGLESGASSSETLASSGSGSETSTTAPTTTTPSGAAPTGARIRKGYLYFSLGLVAASLWC